MNKSGLNFGADNTADFSAFWQTAKNRRHVVFITTILFLLISTVIFFILPDVYTAEVQILVQKPGRQDMVYQQTVTPNFTGEEDYYGTQIAILKGKKITDKIESEFGLKEKSYKVIASRIRASRIISLRIDYKEPALAAKIVNRMAEYYSQDKKEEDLFFAQQLLQWIPESSVTIENGKGVKSSAQEDEAVDFLANVGKDPVIQNLKSQKTETEAKLKELSQRYKAKHPEIKGLQGKLDYLNSQIDKQRRLAIVNLKSNLSGELHITNVRVLSPAVPPEKPSGPPRLIGILLSTLAGLIIGTYLAMFFEYSNQKIRNGEDLNGTINIPFMGFIPLAKEVKNRFKEGGIFGNKNGSLTDVLKTNLKLADAVANVRTNVLISIPYEKSKRIMLTSAGHDEGKTVVSALLALSLANLGRKIVLIDMDLRHPALHKLFGVSNEKGLTDYLIGQASESEMIKSIPGSTLKLINGGTPTPNPAELLSSDRLKEFLDRLSAEYDRMIADVPAADLSIPDALIIAKYMQTSILVGRAGVVKKKPLKSVKEKFELMGRPFIGAVINGVNGSI
ncbi:MAG: hypothetical protein A3A81_02235 [Omnitrophica bacterium RIFCSPLOWO2_01_FULL_45_10b]|nr:MAG: hypothetical protein A3A81_02235 [Omnitrophica bacterium RIFCSPLOWO2_01_FULL_45_10b]